MENESAYALGSFVSGFGVHETQETNNAIFIAGKLLGLGLDYRFEDHGEHGVIDYSLCESLMGITGYAKSMHIFRIGRKLSEYNNFQLKVMAKHLFSRKSGLFPEERKAAKELLKRHFSYT